MDFSLSLKKLQRSLLSGGLSLLIAVTLSSAPVVAETVTPRLFLYDGGKISHLQDEMADDKDGDGLFYLASWNPAPSEVNRGRNSSFLVNFWGQGIGCEPLVENGPVSNGPFDLFEKAKALTGVALDTKHPSARWTPAGKSPGCAGTAHSATGDTFVHVNQQGPGAGGIGLYTYTGPSQKGMPFWQPRGALGQRGSGANQFNEGTFAVFRLNRKDKDAMVPWGGGNGTLEITTRQSVPQLYVEPRSDDASVVQAKQQLTLGFANSACSVRGKQKRGCQIKFLFNIAIQRAGGWREQEKRHFFRAKVMFDRGQGGLPVISGPLGASGNTTTAAGREQVPLWVSNGEPTQFESFSNKVFSVSISHAQFKDALRYVAASRKRKAFNDTTPVEVEELFGPHWNDPQSWRLSGAALGQEVHNPVPGRVAYIGGSVTEIRLEAR
ncbi:hypothetical protein [Nitrosomonas sp. Nm33]|uniref:hypothetical protein n=1 Tax=Nitrosomonas sp. Nm33 TaxID=133724 RepID=UPI0008962F2B|nr:hypothetical protein [Nitrosomonas sp. Nm33]SDY40041.1 hypothetical protein SAMN05421755_102032 [Nitrosomonas sp. Nm33]